MLHESCWRKPGSYDDAFLKYTGVPDCRMACRNLKGGTNGSWNRRTSFNSSYLPGTQHVIFLEDLVLVEQEWPTFDATYNFITPASILFPLV